MAASGEWHTIATEFGLSLSTVGGGEGPEEAGPGAELKKFEDMPVLGPGLGGPALPHLLVSGFDCHIEPANSGGAPSE
jgi:hypothetical protein